MVNVNLNDALKRASTSANRYYSAWDETDKWDEHFQQEYATIILLEACEFLIKKNPEFKDVGLSMLKHFGVR